MPTDNAPTTSIHDLNRDIDSFGADVLTKTMPPNLFTHGERIDAGKPSSNTADPSQPTRAFAEGLFSHGTDLLFGETGKQLPLFVDQVNTLCLMRAGYTLETGVGLKQPHNAAALDPAGVALWDSAARYSRVRALSNMERVALLPKQLAVLRFRREVHKALASALRCAERLVVEAEVEVDKTVRPAVTMLAPLANQEPLAGDLAPLFALTSDPAEKGKATRAAFERGQEVGKEEGHAEGVEIGRAEGRSEAEAALRGQPAPAAGTNRFATPATPATQKPRAARARKRPR